MRKDEMIPELEIFLKEYLNSRGIDLVELIHRYEGYKLVLRLLVDKPDGGISIGECAGLNVEIGELLDEKNMFQERYILEVSSPGLDRPLKSRSDFLRCLNRQVKCFLSEALNGKIEIDGLIKEVLQDGVGIETDSGIVQIPISIINKAKQII
jgi:ribosome maturation factor RimP